MRKLILPPLKKLTCTTLFTIFVHVKGKVNYFPSKNAVLFREKFRGSEHLKLRVGIFFDKVKAINTNHIIV